MNRIAELLSPSHVAVGVDAASKRDLFAFVAGMFEASGGIDAAISSFLGNPSPLPFAKRGDVIGLTGDIQIGVCIGHKVIAAGMEGLVELPMKEVARIRWAV